MWCRALVWVRRVVRRRGDPSCDQPERYRRAQAGQSHAGAAAEMGCDAHAAVRGGEGAGGRRPTAGAAQGRRQRQHKARCRLPAPSCAAGRPLALLPCGPWWAALLLRPAPVCCHLDKAFSARRRQQQWPTVSRPLILNPLSRSIVCSQKPQQENSCRQIWLGNDPAPANCRGWVDRLSGCGRLTV
jgi:hypothetical protein